MLQEVHSLSSEIQESVKMAFNSSNQQLLLSKMATNDGHGENSPYFDGWKAYDSNPYHPIDNKSGVIQMGLAENQVVTADFLISWDQHLMMMNAEAETSLIDIHFLWFLQLCFDLIQQWVINNPEASICTAEGVHNFQEIAIDGDYHGLEEFRNVIKLRKL